MHVRRSDMNGYRSTLAGGGGVDNAGDYTFTLVNGGERSYVCVV